MSSKGSGSANPWKMAAHSRLAKKKSVNVSASVGDDRISELPEFIIHQILSGLSTKEVARTSVLSKRWYHFKASYPILDFRICDFTRARTTGAFPNNFLQAVYSSLPYFSANKLGLHTFRVLSPPTSLYSHLDTWVKLALQNGVKVLEIDMLSDPYTLPLEVFSSKTLISLKLHRCNLNLPLSTFSSVTHLHLSYCHLTYPIVLDNTDCPFLEDLNIGSCSDGSDKVFTLHISSLPRLHSVRLYLWADNRIHDVVVASSIQKLKLRFLCQKPWSDLKLGGCSYRHLKFLRLECGSITDAEFHSFLSKLALLEELCLHDCNKLERIKISGQYLKTLQLTFGRHRHIRIIEIAAPSLKNLIYADHYCDERKYCEIKMEDCCCSSLATMVLFNYHGRERDFRNLISKCTSLEILWILGCPELQRIRVPNTLLRKLHIVRYSGGLKAVHVDSPRLLEICYSGREKPKFAVADSSCGVRIECSSSKLWVSKLKELLAWTCPNQDELHISYTANEMSREEQYL